MSLPMLQSPILVREVDHRMRDNRTYAIPMVYILILGLVTLAAYIIIVQTADPTYRAAEGWVIGKTIFHFIAFTQMGLIILLVPSVSAGAVTGERDKGTLPLLLVTPMPRLTIVVGKFLASVLYVLLLVSTSIPFAALSFGFGGTDLRLLGLTYGCLVATALSIAAMGLAVSTVMRRTVPAVLLAYGLVAALIVGSGVLEIALHIFYPDFESILFVYLNPFTPLVITIYEGLEMAQAHVYWWITPAIQLALALVCLSIAGLRMLTLRD